MSFYYPVFNSTFEPNQGNIRQWLDNLYTRFQPLETCRWNQSNIDELFYAGDQSFVNRQFNFSPSTSYHQYYFNLVQQPINMVTGYERQHIKSFNYVPTDDISPQTTDQYTKLITNISNGDAGGIYHQRSKAKELAARSGMVLVQPYLDYTTDDHAQGSMKLKIWEYNSFIVDPYFRNPDMSDAQFVWCQEFISRNEAESRFPDKVNLVRPISGSPQRLSNFYFLPENYNLTRNDLLIVSYVWYKWRRKKQKLYSRKRNQFFDFAGKEGNLEQLLYNIDDLELVNVEVPCWKLAVVLNDQLMFQGENPLGFDSCPFVPYFWNYDPHINNYNLRVRSLIRTMRDPQFLFNYKVITNNDITSATINAGWKRKVGAVANEDNLKKTGQGFDVIINEGYEMTDVEKIIPSGVPESDMALAQQMADLIYQTSGIQMENWSGQEDKQISALTALIKQAANLMVFQKYFDQWDLADKLLGNLLIQIPLNNWNTEKVEMIIGEEPTEFFYSKVFAKYKVLVEESDLTPTQQNLQAQQMFEINERFGREVFPPSKIIPKLNITGKAEIIEFLQQQEQQMQQQQQQQSEVQHMMEDAQIKKLYAEATDNIALARERNARAESNLGLFEERLSMIGKNRAASVKDKVDALAKLVETIHLVGAPEVNSEENRVERMTQDQEVDEDVEKMQAKHSAEANKFLTEIMGNMNNQGQQQGQEMPQQSPEMAQMR